MFYKVFTMRDNKFRKGQKHTYPCTKTGYVPQPKNCIEEAVLHELEDGSFKDQVVSIEIIEK